LRGCIERRSPQKDCRRSAGKMGEVAEEAGSEESVSHHHPNQVRKGSYRQRGSGAGPAERAMKVSVGLIAVLLGLHCCAASGQVFKGHKIGETAQQFFSIATMAEHNTPTAQYCKDYLANPKVLKAYDRAKAHPGDARALLQAIDVDGCRDVQAALDGKDVKVDARYANELGSGWANFHNSRLEILSFSVKAGNRFEDVVTDISRELGGAEPSKSMVTRQSNIGGLLQERRANWNVNNLQVQADEVKDFEYGDMGVSVMVTDSEYLKEKEATRPNTIR